MGEAIHMKTWNNSDTNSNNIKLVTKYTDLGRSDGKKSLLGIILNVAVPRESTANEHSTFHITVEARTGIYNPYFHLATFENVYVSGQSNQGNFNHIKLFHTPFRDIEFIQLKIHGTGARDFGINDLSLIYRKYRQSNSTSLDEE